MQCPKAAMFDLDDTLAESFKPPRPEAVDGLGRLLARIPVAIISAAGFPRIEHDFLSHLSASEHISRLFVFPNSSSQCYVWKDGRWSEEYNERLTAAEVARIHAALAEAVQTTGVLGPDPKYAPEVIDRESQVAYAALGLNATLADKRAWDPDQKKRRRLKDALEKMIPEFDVLIGGMTTIDITSKGMNKAFGVRWLAERLGIEPSDMVYVGDALYEGGNDIVVVPTGIRTIPVSGPDETLGVLDAICASCE